MKLMPLLVFFCYILGAANAQKDAGNKQFLTKKCKPIQLSLSWKGIKSPMLSSASHFEVLDYRPDTSRIGFWSGNKSKQLVFKGGVRNTLSSYLNNGYGHADGTKSFLIIINKLWLLDQNSIQPRYGTILFRAEVFLKTNNGFIPFTYLDTTIKGSVSASDMASFRFPPLLADLIKKIESVDETRAVKRNLVFSLQQLDSLNKAKFSYPMDTALVLKKGVYANVQEFRNNQPSISNYLIEPDENGLPMLYLKDETGKQYFSRKMWGYCDGQQCYSMMDGNLFPILCVDHAFYVWGSKEYEIKTTSVPVLILLPGAALYGAESMSQTAIRKLRPFCLDVYTGQIY